MISMSCMRNLLKWSFSLIRKDLISKDKLTITGQNY
jgi:hypothetical protein